MKFITEHSQDYPNFQSVILGLYSWEWPWKDRQVCMSFMEMLYLFEWELKKSQPTGNIYPIQKWTKIT